MSFASEILNPFLTTRKQVLKNGEWKYEQELETVSYSKHGINNDLLSGDLEVFNSLGKYTVIEDLNFSTTDRGNIFPQIFIREGNNQQNNILRGVNKDGKGYLLTPLYINHSGNSYFETFESSEEGTSVILKRPIVIPSGCILSFSTRSAGDESNVTYNTYWHER